MWTAESLGTTFSSLQGNDKFAYPNQTYLTRVVGDMKFIYSFSKTTFVLPNNLDRLSGLTYVT